MKYLYKTSKFIHHFFAALSLLLATPVVLAIESTPDKMLQIGARGAVVEVTHPRDSTTTPQQTTSGQGDEEDPPIISIDDPWENFNRSMYGFNLKADKYVLKPLAVGYDKIAPESVQRGITSFFANLQSPVTFVNEVLQGRPWDSAHTLGRFAVNTTVGIGGLFDPASAMGLEHHKEDFGQTFAVWGWKNSNYVVLPLFGPRTLRDATGMVGDIALSPLGQVNSDAVFWGLKSLEITNMRKQQFAYDDLRASALDEYALVRDVWAQKRNQQIQEDSQQQKEHAKSEVN